MRTLNQYINEGLLSTDISDLDASAVIDDFWKLASGITEGKFSIKDREVIAKFLNYLPAVRMWATDNSIYRTDKDAWGIAVKENWFVVLGKLTIHEFKVEDNTMKYKPVNANWYMGPTAITRMEIKRQFDKSYKESGCQVFWIDKKKVNLFKK